MSVAQTCVILHHPRCPDPILEAPMLDPSREELPLPTRESILAAWRASNEERKAANLPAHPMPYSLMSAVITDHEEMRRLNAKDAIALLIEEHGMAQVKRWIRNIALLQGGE